MSQSYIFHVLFIRASLRHFQCDVCRLLLWAAVSLPSSCRCTSAASWTVKRSSGHNDYFNPVHSPSSFLSSVSLLLLLCYNFASFMTPAWSHFKQAINYRVFPPCPSFLTSFLFPPFPHPFFLLPSFLSFLLLLAALSRDGVFGWWYSEWALLRQRAVIP